MTLLHRAGFASCFLPRFAGTASPVSRAAIRVSRDLQYRGCSSSRPGAEGTLSSQFWTWTTQPRPHWRESKVEAAVVFVVFGITGSTSVALVRPTFKTVTGIEGTMADGPWSYRIGSLLLVSPVYAVVLMTVGTLSGRHTYFAAMGKKILGRFVPRSLGKHIQGSPAKANARDTKLNGS